MNAGLIALYEFVEHGGVIRSYAVKKLKNEADAVVPDYTKSRLAYHMQGAGERRQKSRFGQFVHDNEA